MSALGVLLLAQLAQLAPADGVLAVDERWPVMLAVFNPRPDNTRLGVSDVRVALDVALRQDTALYLSSLDPEVSACAGRLGCVASAFRDRRDSTLAVVVSVIAMPSGRDRVVALVMDLERAEEVSASLPDDEYDGRVTERAVRETVPPVELDSVAGLSAWARGVAARVAVHHDGERGEIRLSSSIDRFAVELDGRTIGTSTRAQVSLTGLRSGARRLRFSAPGFLPIEAVVDVLGEQSSTLALRWVDQRSLTLRVRPSTRWAAASTTVVAGVLIGVGLAQAGGVAAGCLAATGQSCEAVGPPRLVPGDGPLDVRGSGPLTMPLGVAIGVGGAAMIASDLLANEGDEAPWWLAPAIGVVAASLSYGVAELVAPH